LGKDITVKGRLGPEVTTIDGNMAGSVVVFKNGETEKAVLEGFTITNGSGDINIYNNRVGGGIYIDNSKPRIINNRIINNKSNQGGGIWCFNEGSNPEIVECYIADNKVVRNSGSGGCGGGIKCHYSNAVIMSCEIVNNYCEVSGGGIEARSKYMGQSQPIIRNNIIKGNVAVSKGGGSGGGINCRGGVIPHIENNIISENRSSDGGGIYIYEGYIINNIIMNNVAECFGSGYGGGISASGGFYVEIDNNIIINNQALSIGGGVLWGNYSGKIRNNIICYNKASGATTGETLFGGGIAIYQSTCGKTVISNCIIANNLSEDYGGGIGAYGFSNNASAIMINNTMYGNEACKAGSGIYINKESKLTVINSIIYDNINDQITVEVPGPIVGDINIAVNYCNIKEGWGGHGNIDSDPMFADPLNLDFHIKYNSPCRNAGDKTLIDLPTTDFENDPRIAHGEVDMGADEFYNHLYFTGLSTHGAPIDLKITGQPGTAPLFLYLSMEANKIPKNTKWGDWYLEYPVVGPVLLGQIPAVDGIYVLPGMIPSTPTGHYDFHMQALIGQDLTNCCSIEVK